MLYKYSIDDAIMKQLYKSNSLSFLELRRRIECDFNRSISKDTFNSHIKKLAKSKVLEKEDDNVRGKPVFYSLSVQARKQYHLHLLSSPNAEEYRLLYNVILIYSFRFDPATSPSIKECELDSWLRQIGHSIKDLRIDIEATQSWHEADKITNILCIDELIEQDFIPEMVQRREQLLQDDRLSKESKDTLKKIDDPTRDLDYNELENLLREFWKIDKVGFDPNTSSIIFYYQIEEIELTKYNSSVTETPIYYYILPGFSISEILQEQQKQQLQQQSTKANDVMPLSNEKINDGIEALLDLGLVRKSIFINGEQRYSIAGFKLAQMLSEYKKLIVNYWNVMTDIWIWRRAPTEDERDWIRVIMA